MKNGNNEALFGYLRILTNIQLFSADFFRVVDKIRRFILHTVVSCRVIVQL